jgi:hypothetical protein
VLAGVPYYAGNKTLKKGTMPDRGQNQYGGSVGAGTDYIAIRDLPEGCYHADDAKNAPEARAKMTEFGTAGKAELMAGYTMTSKEGLRIGGTLILSGNADTSDVLVGKEFYTNDPKTKKRGTLALSGSATAADVLAGKTFYNTDAKSKQGGQMADNGDWSATLAPGGSITVPPGKHSGGGSVVAKPLKTITLNVANWPHAYPAMEWNYTLTGGTLVGIAGLDGASGDGSSNIVDSIRIVGNTIYVANRQGGTPIRNITLLYY